MFFVVIFCVCLYCNFSGNGYITWCGMHHCDASEYHNGIFSKLVQILAVYEEHQQEYYICNLLLPLLIDAFHDFLQWGKLCRITLH